MTMEKSFEFGIVTQESIENRLGRQRRCHRKIASRHPLGERQKVWLHTFVLAGEKRRISCQLVVSPASLRLACPPKTCHHLIRDQLGPKSSGNFRHTPQPSCRM